MRRVVPKPPHSRRVSLSRRRGWWVQNPKEEKSSCSLVMKWDRWASNAVAAAAAADEDDDEQQQQQEEEDEEKEVRKQQQDDEEEAVNHHHRHGF